MTHGICITCNRSIPKGRYIGCGYLAPPKTCSRECERKTYNSFFCYDCGKKTIQGDRRFYYQFDWYYSMLLLPE
jgi:hypothetical protein